MPQIEFENRNQATNFLAECAKLAYGSGMLEGKSGGNGNIGMLGDRVVKFRTHLSERSGEVTKNMSDSCAELRNNLLNSVRALLTKDDGDVDAAGNAFIEALKRDLDIGKFQDDDSNSQKAKSLLDRKVVAKVIDKIEKFTNDRIFDKALNGQTPASSKGVDTTFKAVITRKTNEILVDYGKQMSALADTIERARWSVLEPEQKQKKCLEVAKLLKNIADFVLNESCADWFATYLSGECWKCDPLDDGKWTGKEVMEYISAGLKQSIGKWERSNSCGDDGVPDEPDMKYVHGKDDLGIVPWDKSKWGFLKDQNLFGSMQALEEFVNVEKTGASLQEFNDGSCKLRDNLSLLIAKSTDLKVMIQRQKERLEQESLRRERKELQGQSLSDDSFSYSEGDSVEEDD